MARSLKKVQKTSEEIKNFVQGIAESVKDISVRIGLSSMPALDELEEIEPFFLSWRIGQLQLLIFSKPLLKIVKNWAISIIGWNRVKGVLALSTIGITLANGIVVVVFTASSVLQVRTLITALVDYHKGSLTDAAVKLRSYVENLEQDWAELEVLMNYHYLLWLRQFAMNAIEHH